ncbi:MAG: DUF5343 domain-containing protein [Bacteroidetes bacterium]|nr:DUF5343 domain-containing protein [Bacteroidota bacterium]
MADKHPYVQGLGALVQVIAQFRKSFPAKVDASTLKKLGIAPNNESYVLNVVRFLGLIDQEGKKTTDATKIFNLHDDTEFSKAFAGLVSKAYAELFELHGDGTWALDNTALINFFRTHDETTAVVGKLQASTFKGLAAHAGHGEIPTAKAVGPKKEKQVGKAVSKKSVATVPSAAASTPQPGKSEHTSGGVGLTVRIEINLPADGDQETYDRIFKSIRENLLNG